MVSWGAHLNTTYQRMLREILPSSIVRIHATQKTAFSSSSVSFKRIYLPALGICHQIREYKSNQDLEISSSEQDEYHVFITDPNKQYTYAIDYSSHEGDKIRFSNENKTYYYKVALKATKRTVEDDEDNCQTESFENCVQHNLESVFLPRLSCIPPWMSKESQCKEAIKNSSLYSYMTEPDGYYFIPYKNN